MCVWGGGGGVGGGGGGVLVLEDDMIPDPRETSVLLLCMP